VCSHSATYTQSPCYSPSRSQRRYLEKVRTVEPGMTVDNKQLTEILLHKQKMQPR